MLVSQDLIDLSGIIYYPTLWIEIGKRSINYEKRHQSLSHPGDTSFKDKLCQAWDFKSSW